LPPYGDMPGTQSLLVDGLKESPKIVGDAGWRMGGRSSFLQTRCAGVVAVDVESVVEVPPARPTGYAFPISGNAYFTLKQFEAMRSQTPDQRSFSGRNVFATKGHADHRGRMATSPPAAASRK